MTTDACPKCGGMMQYVKDADGPYLRCFMGCLHIDLLQPPQADLDLLAQFPGPNARRDVAHAVSTVR